ncbi:MAG: ribose-5-phosphate isomerase RpiA [Isosphaera sp.]|nr:ribose-5-phosphate isomerase RpiA [Isosphaera sp.]
MTPPDLGPVAAHALTLVPDGAVVGLGTGRAAAAFLDALGARVAAGLRVRGVPTSEESAATARRLGIPLLTFDEVAEIDVAVDGADEVDPAGNLIKGYGGALLREKVVAAAARRFVVLVGPEKLVPVLGTRGRLPVEVVPFAAGACARRLAALGYPSKVREHAGRPFVTDNGNHVLDLAVGPLADPAGLDAAIRAIPGVVGTGLFVGMNPTVVTPNPAGGVTVRG